MNVAADRPIVTVIPPTVRRSQRFSQAGLLKKRVAAYARVSTDLAEQLNSYDAQVDYYSGHIRANADWEFVEVYTDEGISATNTKKRDGFNRMVQDALDGKIDLILTNAVITKGQFLFGGKKSCKRRIYRHLQDLSYFLLSLSC